MARAAATPPKTASSHRQHPPYKEMILNAVGALKERKGSSRVAIAKFIKSAYSDLPHTHDALLSTHIRRLREQGLLLMVKHSYKLVIPSPPPPSAPAILAPKRGRGRPPKHPPGPLTAPAPRRGRNLGRPPKQPNPFTTPAPKRGRGRPPRQLARAPVPARKRGRPPKALNAASVLKTGRGRPRKLLIPVPAPTRGRGRPPKQPAQTLLLPRVEKVKSGPVKLSEKRKPGRPPRSLAGLVYARVMKPKNNAALPTGNRKRGRPLKSLTLSAAAAMMGRRKPGRPRKVPVSAPLTERPRPVRPPKNLVGGVAFASNSTSSLVKRRKSGWPPKATSAAEGLVYLSRSKKPKPNLVPMDMTTSTKKKNLGRPRKMPMGRGGSTRLGKMPQDTVEKNRITIPTTKKRGRPRKDTGSLSAPVAGTIVSGEKMKRPVGRPRKVVMVPPIVAESSQGANPL